MRRRKRRNEMGICCLSYTKTWIQDDDGMVDNLCSNSISRHDVAMRVLVPSGQVAARVGMRHESDRPLLDFPLHKLDDFVLKGRRVAKLPVLVHVLVSVCKFDAL